MPHSLIETLDRVGALFLEGVVIGCSHYNSNSSGTIHTIEKLSCSGAEGGNRRLSKALTISLQWKRETDQSAKFNLKTFSPTNLK